ncbi:hypothetical protein [Bacillus xiapuensis]|uniref:hypothetical protein n=1 Tax=Bacillus xiapuensis TaxID=2014075 RepID=UPI000C249E20|nr:hypothetical protein [Bacillus xiapuensis]
MLPALVLNMLYLYFPEDKSEYIPAAISMFIFMTAAVLFFLFIRKISKKEAEKAKELEGKYKIDE